MASTTDYDWITDKTYKATRPNGSEFDFSDEGVDDWAAPMIAAAGSGWGANFRNLTVQSMSLMGYINYTKNGEILMYVRPTAVYNTKVGKSGTTPSAIVSGYYNAVASMNTDIFAEDIYGMNTSAAENPDKITLRGIVKGEVLVGTDSWMEFTATFYNDKVVLSNYNTQGVIGPKVDAYLETLTGYKTEA